MSLTLRIYRRLARAFPQEFQLAYGEEMTDLGEVMVDDIGKRHGFAGLARLIADIAVRVPIEYLSEMRRDMRHSWRALMKSPGFALVGILSMGIGIGLTTNVYSTRWTVLFRNMPGAANAERLAMPQLTADGDPEPASYYYIEQYREQKDLFSGVAALRTSVPFNVTYQGNFNAKPERVFGQIVSPDYFDVLGVKPQRGRLLSDATDKPGNAAAVVITDRFWRNRLNSSPDAVGQALHLNGQVATIVGITPKDFNGALAINPSELFVATTAPAAVAPELANDVLHDRSAKVFLPILCLAPGVSFDRAEAGLDTATRRLDAQDPSVVPRTDKGRRLSLLQAGTRVPMPRKIKPVLAGFFIVLMGLVITLACMNLANMLMARGAGRRKELAIRLSVGASRARLVRQMMAEGILLSLLGGVAGFGLAYVLGALDRHFTTPTAIPLEHNLPLDWSAAAFAFGLAIVCGIGFSLPPALQATRSDLTPALKESMALQLPGYRRLGLRNLLMVAQVSASLMLLLITGFLVLGIAKSSSVETKVDPEAMYLLSVDPVRDGYTPAKAQDFFEKLPERLKTISSVESVALASEQPFSADVEPQPMTAEAAGESSQDVLGTAVEQTIGAGYFATLGEPVLEGREFNENDQRQDANASGATKAGSLPAVLNESAERRLFGKQDAIGKPVKDYRGSYYVVGIVRDIRDVQGFTQATVYLPLTARDFAQPPAGGMAIIVQGRRGGDVLGAIRNEIAFLDPNLNLFDVETLKSYLDRGRSALEFSLQTYGSIGLFGLILAAIGLAGVTAYAVAQRRKEIGIRMALGATRGSVLRLVMREGAAMVCVGTVLGFLGAVGLTKAIGALVNMFADALKFGTTDPRLLIGAPALLAFVALLACYLPARRSTRIDPLRALREE
jgi:predicted permease